MKKALTAILIAALCSANFAAFADETVKASGSAIDVVNAAKEINIIGDSIGSDFPEKITREEFCGFISSYLENAAQISLKPSGNPPFTDTSNADIGVLNSMGIIKGKSAAEFAPNDLLTREEAAAIIYRLIEKIYPNQTESAQHFDFADSNQISEWAVSSVQELCNIGIMQCIENNTFAPKALFTTEQAIATLVRVYNSFASDKDISNAENMSYVQIEDLQNSVNNGHFPWRLDYEQVIMSFLSGNGKNVENGKLVCFAVNGDNFSGEYRTENETYTFKLFKPIDKSENGIWIVKSYKTTESLVDEKFKVFSLPWGEKWENIKDSEIFKQKTITADDENRFVVEVKNAEFLGVKGTMAFLFSPDDGDFPCVGLMKAYFAYDEKDEKELLKQGLNTYGERKSVFLDENGIENPLSPAAWFINEYIESSLLANEREYYEKILKDKGIEETRIDAAIRGPLVIITVHEDENLVTIDGNNAAAVFNLRNLTL